MACWVMKLLPDELSSEVQMTFSKKSIPTLQELFLTIINIRFISTSWSRNNYWAHQFLQLSTLIETHRASQTVKTRHDAMLHISWWGTLESWSHRDSTQSDVDGHTALTEPQLLCSLTKKEQVKPHVPLHNFSCIRAVHDTGTILRYLSINVLNRIYYPSGAGGCHCGLVWSISLVWAHMVYEDSSDQTQLSNVCLKQAEDCSRTDFQVFV